MNPTPEMTMKFNLFAPLLAASLAASAQTPRPPHGFPSLPEIVFDSPALPPGGSHTLEVHVGEGAASERRVNGAPYCADAIHETVQPLLDADGTPGNRIVRRQASRLCRDGEGRTRQEVERGGRKWVYLHDPVAREAWVLDSERKTARALLGAGAGAQSDHATGPLHAMTDSAAWRDYSERLREWARGMAERTRAAVGRAAPTPPAPPAPPTSAGPAREAEVVTIVRQGRDEADPAQREVQVRVLRTDGATAPLQPLPRLMAPPGVAWAAESFAARGPAALTSLGSKKIEGLDVHGQRSTWTLAAGQVGNDKPIVMLREVWTSPELMLAVQVRDFDPRRGETHYRLVNIKRGEPDPALMKVPPDHARNAPAAGRG